MTLRNVVDCRRSDVRALTQFVEARLVDDRRLASVGAPPDDVLTDLCDVADCVLGRVRDCQRSEPCTSSGRLVAAMVQVALLHSEHPDFQASWFALGRGGDDAPVRSTAWPDARISSEASHA